MYTYTNLQIAFGLKHGIPTELVAQIKFSPSPSASQTEFAGFSVTS